MARDNFTQIFGYVTIVQHPIKESHNFLTKTKIYDATGFSLLIEDQIMHTKIINNNINFYIYKFDIFIQYLLLNKHNIAKSHFHEHNHNFIGF